MGRDQVDAVFPEVVIECVTVIDAIAKEMLQLRFQYVEGESKLH